MFPLLVFVKCMLPQEQGQGFGGVRRPVAVRLVEEGEKEARSAPAARITPALTEPRVPGLKCCGAVVVPFSS